MNDWVALLDRGGQMIDIKHSYSAPDAVETHFVKHSVNYLYLKMRRQTQYL